MSVTDVTVVCLLRLDLTKLPSGVTLNTLPEVLGYESESLLGPALQQERFYAVPNFAAVRSAVNRLAEPFDDTTIRAPQTPGEGRVIPLFGGRDAPGAS